MHCHPSAQFGTHPEGSRTLGSAPPKVPAHATHWGQDHPPRAPAPTAVSQSSPEQPQRAWSDGDPLRGGSTQAPACRNSGPEPNPAVGGGDWLGRTGGWAGPPGKAACSPGPSGDGGQQEVLPIPGSRCSALLGDAATGSPPGSHYKGPHPTPPLPPREGSLTSPRRQRVLQEKGWKP